MTSWYPYEYSQNLLRILGVISDRLSMATTQARRQKGVDTRESLRLKYLDKNVRHLVPVRCRNATHSLPRIIWCTWSIPDPIYPILMHQAQLPYSVCLSSTRRAWFLWQKVTGRYVAEYGCDDDDAWRLDDDPECRPACSGHNLDAKNFAKMVLRNMWARYVVYSR